MAQESAARTTARPAETGSFDAVVIGAGRVLEAPPVLAKLTMRG